VATRRAWATTAAVVLTGTLVAAGCQGSSGGTGGSGGDGAGSKEAPAKLSITPASGTKQVKPNAGVTVRVAHGKIGKVTVHPRKGDDAVGKSAKDGTSWRTTWGLTPGAHYTVTATATGDDGKPVTSKSTFTTLKPDAKLKSGMSPLDSETVGVGMPVQVLLSHAVKSDADKKKVERSLEVRASKKVEGAWYWASDEEVDFRPRTYWPSGTKVHAIAHLAGVQVGKDRWGVKDRETDFTVGDRHVTHIKNDAHKMIVKSGGKVVKSVPVSLGKPGHDTYSGTAIVQEKSPDIVMDSATTGDPGAYRIPTKWNVRMTYSGTFIHSAPWSVGSQGSTNVSHGCVNAAPSNAHWFYNFSNRGDIIKVTGTSRKLEFGNGPTPWVLSWKEWQKGSALDRTVTTQPLKDSGTSSPSSSATPAPSTS